MRHLKIVITEVFSSLMKTRLLTSINSILTSKEKNMEEEKKTFPGDDESVNFDGFASMKEAYEAGKRSGLIEGYLRTTENITTTIARLQEIFMRKFEGGNK